MWPVPSIEPGGDVDVVYYESHEASTPANPECVENIEFTNLFRVNLANSLVDTYAVNSRDVVRSSGSYEGHNRHLQLVHNRDKYLPQLS